jgi:hypothetical protein
MTGRGKGRAGSADVRQMTPRLWQRPLKVRLKFHFQERGCMAYIIDAKEARSDLSAMASVRL